MYLELPLQKKIDLISRWTCNIPTQEVDLRKGIIRFSYDGSEFEVTVRKIG